MFFLVCGYRHVRTHLHTCLNGHTCVRGHTHTQGDMYASHIHASEAQALAHAYTKAYATSIPQSRELHGWETLHKMLLK